MLRLFFAPFCAVESRAAFVNAYTVKTVLTRIKGTVYIRILQ